MTQKTNKKAKAKKPSKKRKACDYVKKSELEPYLRRGDVGMLCLCMLFAAFMFFLTSCCYNGIYEDDVYWSACDGWGNNCDSSKEIASHKEAAADVGLFLLMLVTGIGGIISFIAGIAGIFHSGVWE